MKGDEAEQWTFRESRPHYCGAREIRLEPGRSNDNPLFLGVGRHVESGTLSGNELSGHSAGPPCNEHLRH